MGGRRRRWLGEASAAMDSALRHYVATQRPGERSALSRLEKSASDARLILQRRIRVRLSIRPLALLGRVAPQGSTRLDHCSNR